MTNVTMPSLGFDMTAGKVARWLKKEGDEITKGQAVAEVETEKATVEIEAFASGVLQKILVPAGETVPVNTPIGIIADAGEQVAASPAPSPQSTSMIDQAEEAPPSSTTPDQRTRLPAQPSAPSSPAPSDGERVKISPVARNMANAAGLKIESIKGTGPGGRITEKDVRARIAQQAAAPAPQPAIPATSAPAPQTAPASMPASQQQVSLSRMRQTIAQRMTQSKTTTPHFYVTMEINMAEAMKLREQLNALASDAEKISVNDLIVAAVARTLPKFPTFNASYQGDKLDMHSNINIGIAVAVEEGLLTPVLHDADKKVLKQIASETKAMSERARANKMRPEDLGPSTFTVSNLGMFGVDEFAAIINPPEAAILAVGAVTKRAVVIDEQIAIAPMMKATLAVDHRVADGAQAGRFLQEFKKLLENPVNLLLS